MTNQNSDPRPADIDDQVKRVVIQNGEYWLCNKGDLAMLAVTVRRLRERWPSARIGVITSAPLLLRAYAPEAEPISDRGSGDWPERGLLARWAARSGPGAVGPVSVAWLVARDVPLRYVRRVLRALHRQTATAARSRRPLEHTRDTLVAEAGTRRRIPNALRDASLVLVMGGGYLTDVDADQTNRTFDLLEYAADAGIPTAMVGQGLGPIEDAGLLARAAKIFPRVDVISLREGRRGPALLDRLGVPAERVTVTGDDAIELSYDVRQPALGSAIGVCLRVADYSPVAAQTKEAVGRAVQTVAREVGSGLIPLIISEYRSEDRRSTLPLVKEFAGAAAPLGRYVPSRELAQRVSQCRVLVTGAYHLAVFALSQGIPVVGLSASTYYDDKLYGLAEMFGGGLRLVRLDEPDLEGRLSAATRSAWEEAEDVRTSLRKHAVTQIAASKEGFDRIFGLVERSRRKANDPA